MRFTRLTLCALLMSGAANANDLLQIYDQALNNDTTLQASGHQRDALIEVLPQARAGYLPQVDAGYGVSHDNTTTETNPGSTPCALDPVTAAPIYRCKTTSDSHGLTLTLNQNIFDWQTIQQIRQAGDQVALADTGYRAAEQDLILRVASAYFTALSATDSLRSSQAENKALERQLEQAQRRFEVGLSAITDVQDAQARYDLTLANIISGQQALDSAKESLGVITGEAPGKLSTLQEDLPLPAPNPLDVTAWVGKARENNLSVISAQLTAEAARKGISIAQSGHLPTVGFQDQYTDGTSGGRFAGKSKQNSIGLQLSLPIFSGGYTQSTVRAADATHAQRVSELEGQKRLADKQTRDAYQGVLAGAALVKALKQAVLSNTTALQASETGFEVGARTSVDVLNAEQLLYGAQRDYYKSRYDYLYSVLTLKASAGMLSVADLQEIDRLLVADAAPPSTVPPMPRGTPAPEAPAAPAPAAPAPAAEVPAAEPAAPAEPVAPAPEQSTPATPAP